MIDQKDIDYVREQYEILNNQITCLCRDLLNGEEFIDANVIMLGQNCPSTLSAPILKRGSLPLLNQAIKQHQFDPGDDSKRVLRFPGYVQVMNHKLWQLIINQINMINAQKMMLSKFIITTGKVKSITDEQGNRSFLTNDLLYQSLPMHNLKMIERQITYIKDPVQKISSGWNIDFNREKPINNIDEFIESLESRYNKLDSTMLVSIDEWQSNIEKTILFVRMYAQQNIQLRIIRPRPVELILRFKSFDLPLTRIKPRLPVFVHNLENKPVKLNPREITPPPIHTKLVNDTQKMQYKRLNPYMHLYACIPF